MPLPIPNDEEAETDFIGRCMKKIKTEFPDQKRRIAVCYSQWRKKKGGEKPKDYVMSSPNLIIKSFPDKLKLWTIKEGDIEKHYMEVPLSGTAEDRDGERVSEKAFTEMINQLKSGKLPVFSNHGIDKDGKRVYRWQDMIGKWIDGRIETTSETEKILFATMMRNEANPEAIKLWEYANAGMPIGFSIGGKAKRESFEEVEE